jgi:hypothetical protein
MSHVDDGTLNALLDGELPADETQAVQAHLSACATCRSRFEEAHRFLAEAGELIDVLAPLTAAPPEDAAAPRKVASTAKEAAVPLEPGAPTSETPPEPEVAAGERRVSRTARESAVNIDAQTQKSPAVRPIFGGRGGPEAEAPARPEAGIGATAPSPAILDAPPARRRGLDLERLAWAASVVLALSVGFLVNEVRLARREAHLLSSLLDTAVTGEVAVAAPGEAPPGGSRDQRGAAGARPPAVASRPAGARGTKPPTPAEAAELALRGAERDRGAVRQGAPQQPSRRPSAPAAGGAADRAAAGAPARPPAGAGVRTPTGDLAPREAPRARAAQQLGRRPPPARAEDSAAPAAALELPGQTEPARFRPVSFEEAITRLSGSIRLIDGLQPLRVEVGSGRLVPGSDPDRDVIRVVYADPRGRLLVLDQQPGQVRPDAAGIVSVNGLMRGDTLTTSAGAEGVRVRWVDRKNFWLSLTGSLAPDSMRVLVERIR